MYCLNNPINLDDDRGNWPKWTKKVVAAAAIIGVGVAVVAVSVATGGIAAPLIGAATGAVISGGVSAIAQTVTTGEINPELVLLDACAGAIGGALGVANLGFGASLAINAGINGLSYIGSQILTDQNIKASELAINIGSAAITEYIGSKTVGSLSSDAYTYLSNSKKIKAEYKLGRTNLNEAFWNIKNSNYKKFKCVERYKYNFGVNVVGTVAGHIFNQIPTAINNVVKLF